MEFNLSNLTLEQLERALEIRRSMHSLEQELNSLFGAKSPGRRGRPAKSRLETVTLPATRGRKKTSAAARAKIAAAKKNGEQASHSSSPTPAKEVRSRKGGVKDKIIETLKWAGKEGLDVKALAEKIGSKPANVYVWFYATGKKITQIKKNKETGNYYWED